MVASHSNHWYMSLAQTKENLKTFLFFFQVLDFYTIFLSFFPVRIFYIERSKINMARLLFNT